MKKKKPSLFNRTNWVWWFDFDKKRKREKLLSLEFDHFFNLFFNSDNSDTKKYAEIKMRQINVELEDMAQQDAMLMGDLQTVPSKKKEGGLCQLKLQV